MAEQPVRTTVHWRNLDVIAPNVKEGIPKWQPRGQILSGVSGYAASGNGPECGLVAVMGTSGSGKSTLLSIILGRSRADSGELQLNGADYDADTSQSIGFVPQVDQLFASLSVAETMWLHSTLRGGRRSVSEDADQKDEARIGSILTTLGLDDAANTRVGDPSAAPDALGRFGGERKRLGMALELLHKPALLVLDEPTSGLDSAAAIDVLRALNTLARAETAVVISLHQPPTRLPPGGAPRAAVAAREDGLLRAARGRRGALRRPRLVPPAADQPRRALPRRARRAARPRVQHPP